jgi:pyruvate dehydrogenase E1 component alpha subunit
LPRILIEGNDVEAVYETANDAIARARDGGGPSLIEAITYRHKGHSRTDPGKYRPAEEVESWLQRDPVAALRRRLEEAGWEGERLDAIGQEVRREVEEAADRALASPEPAPTEMSTDVFCSEETTWRN